MARARLVLPRGRAGHVGALAHNANVGIATGGRLAVVDVDTYKGIEVPDWLPRATRTVASPGGGWHFYFRVRLPVLSFDLEGGAEVKGEGRFVVAPGSIADYRKGDRHVTGRWELVEDAAPLEVDPNLFMEHRAWRRPDADGGLPENWRPFEFVPQGEMLEGEGRNDHTARAAGWLFRRGNDPETVERILLDYARECYPFFGVPDPTGDVFNEEELRATVRSIYKTHATRQQAQGD
jgi:hypothetical protein